MSVFKFKQFDVDQTGCAMKINTDGALLGALAQADRPQRILDVGTGTGVIAMMLAQRFAGAKIDAVEIDHVAAQTAGRNFSSSVFADRLHLYADGFEDYFENNPNVQYDLIVSNPPFFLNSLLSPGAKKSLAKHTDESFFDRLINACARHLTAVGTAQLILPIETATIVKALLPGVGLHLQKQVNIQSFTTDNPHRELITFGKKELPLRKENFVIYDAPKIYSAAYQNALRAFFTIF